MRTNLLKEKLARGEPCRGIWLGLPSAFSARILARLPLDWLLIDGEHAPVGLETLSLMTAAIAEANGPAPLARIAQASVDNIKQALDSGAHGIIAPMINTAEEAEHVVAWAKFPPVGLRSFGSAYPGLSFDMSMAEYQKQSNDQTLVIVQIESQAALGNLDEIFAVPGIDLAFVGPVDLAISLGVDPFPPENQHPIFLEALEEIKRAARARKMPLGIYCSDGRAAAARIREGFLLVNVTSDTNLLQRGLLAELEASNQVEAADKSKAAGRRGAAAKREGAA